MVPKGGEAYREAHAVATASHHGREIPRNSKWGWWNPGRGKATEICVCVCVYRRSTDEYFFGEGKRGLVAFWL